MQSSTRRCPCCSDLGKLKFSGKVDESLLSSSSYSSRKIPELMHYPYLECVNCRTLFVENLPSCEFLQSSYNDAEFVSRTDSVYAAQTYFDQLSRMNLLKRGRLLDIGCSDGAFISKVESESVIKVLGIEPSLQAIENADSSVRERIHHTTLERFEGESEFTVITCFQTVEHLNDLDGLITKSKKLLVNEGHLALVCHDRFSIVNRILGEKSPIFDIEHLQILNKVGVKLLLKRHGFVDVKVRTISNKYPIAYWLLLSPIPKVAKNFIDVRRDNWYFSWGVRIRVGNLIAVGKQASE